MSEHLPLLLTIIAVGASVFALVIGFAVSFSVQP